VFLAIAISLGYVLQKRIEWHAVNSTKASNQKMGLLVETIEGAETIKSGSGGWGALSKWIDKTEEAMQHDMALRSISEKSTFITATLQQVSYVALMATGAYFAAEGFITMGALNDDKKEKLKEFVKFVKNELDLKSVPTISIQNGRGELKTTANYDYTKENKIIKVNSKNRALVDVMRSVAHELVHHKQYEQGRLKVKPPDIGGEIEDEANAKAGQFIKMFAQKDSSIYDE
jgi:hypothetical protein